MASSSSRNSITSGAEVQNRQAGTGWPRGSFAGTFGHSIFSPEPHLSTPEERLRIALADRYRIERREHRQPMTEVKR
jgi:hypothetical protein